MAGNTVLIIDDDDSLALAMRVRLEAAGFSVIRCDRGEEGVRQATEHLPACVVLDLRMPGIDGYEVLRRIRAERSTAAMPVIVVSANVQDEACRRALEGGADRFVGKPYNAVHLVEVINELISHRPQRASA